MAAWNNGLVSPGFCSGISFPLHCSYSYYYRWCQITSLQLLPQMA